MVSQESINDYINKLNDIDNLNDVEKLNNTKIDAACKALAEASPGLLSEKSSRGDTLLILASRYGWIDTVKFLLSMDGASIDINCKGSVSTALYAAHYRSNIAIALLLIAHRDINVFETSSLSGGNILHAAISADSTEFALALINTDKTKPLINQLNLMKQAPLHYAVDQSNDVVVSSLLNNNADINALGLGRSTALDLAVRKYSDLSKMQTNSRDQMHKIKLALLRYEKIVGQLVGWPGINLTLSQFPNETLLQKAIEFQWKDIVSVLKRNHPVNADASYIDKLTDVASDEECKALALQHLNLLSEKTGSGENILHIATKYRWIDTIRALMASEQGRALINIKNAKDDTPLAIAMRKNDEVHPCYDALKLLLNHESIDLLIKHKNYRANILLVAVDLDLQDLVYILMNSPHAKSLVNEKSEMGYTLLHYAVCEGKDNIAIMLAEHHDWAKTEGETGSELLSLAVDKFLAYNREINRLGVKAENTQAKLQGFQRIIQFLIEKTGVDITTVFQSKQENILHFSVKHDFKLLLEMLMQSSGVKSLISSKDENALTPLHYAIVEANYKTVDILFAQTEVAHIDSLGINASLACAMVRLLHLQIYPLKPGEDKQRAMKKVQDYQKIIQLFYRCLSKESLRDDFMDMLRKNIPNVLHVAAKSNWELIVKMLMEHFTGKALVNSKDGEGHTPLYYAASEGHDQIVAMFIDHVDDSHALSVLRVAVNKLFWNMMKCDQKKISHYHKTIKLLVDKTGSDIADMLQSEDYYILHSAVENNWPLIVKMLMQTSSAQALVELEDSNGYTPLDHAVTKGKAEMLAMMLPIGRDFISKMKANPAALIHVINKLMEVAQSKSNSKEDAVRQYAVRLFGYRQTFRLLVDKTGIDVASIPQINDTKFFNHAIHGGWTETANIFLRSSKAKDFANMCDAKGCKPLHYAACAGDVDIVEKLIALDDDINACTPNGRTPLLYGAMNGNVSVVRLLLQANAKINLETKDGKTVLYWAVMHGCKEVVLLLIKQRGINLSETYAGLTIDQVAQNKKWTDVAKVLASVRAGVDVGVDIGSPAKKTLRWTMGGVNQQQDRNTTTITAVQKL